MGDRLSVIRPLREEEIALLCDFLYEAIFIPEGVEAPPKSVVDLPELRLYIEDFGKWADDLCLVAECDGKVVGAVWTRIMNDYGHVTRHLRFPYPCMRDIGIKALVAG